MLLGQQSQRRSCLISLQAGLARGSSSDLRLRAWKLHRAKKLLQLKAQRRSASGLAALHQLYLRTLLL